MRQSFEDKCEMRGGVYFKMVRSQSMLELIKYRRKIRHARFRRNILKKKNFLAVPCGLYNLSSPTKDRTQAHSCEGNEA